MINGNLITPRAIARSWGVTDKHIAAFLASHGVNPVSAFKYGRGTMRLYHVDALNMRATYVQEQEKKRAADLAAIVETERSQSLEAQTKRKSATAERLDRIEAKLDKLVSALS